MLVHTSATATAIAALIATYATADTGQIDGWDEPLVVNGELVFPEGARIPKSMTATEARFIGPIGIVPPRGTTAPPIGPVRCASEY